MAMPRLGIGIEKSLPAHFQYDAWGLEIWIPGTPHKIRAFDRGGQGYSWYLEHSDQATGFTIEAGMADCFLALKCIVIELLKRYDALPKEVTNEAIQAV